MDTIKQAMDREGFRNYKLLNGYRRVDPQRGMLQFEVIDSHIVSKYFVHINYISQIHFQNASYMEG